MKLTKEERKKLVDAIVWNCLIDDDFLESRIHDLAHLNNDGVLPDWYSPDWQGQIWTYKRKPETQTRQTEKLLERYMKLLVKCKGDELRVFLK